MVWIFGVIGIIGMFYIIRLIGRSIEKQESRSEYMEHILRNTVDVIPHSMNKLIHIIGHDAATDSEKIECRKTLHKTFIEFVFSLGVLSVSMPEYENQIILANLSFILDNERSDDYQGLMSGINLIVRNINELRGVPTIESEETNNVETESSEEE